MWCAPHHTHTHVFHTIFKSNDWANDGHYCWFIMIYDYINIHYIYIIQYVRSFVQFLWTLFLDFLLFQRALWRQRIPWMFAAPWRTKKPWSAFPNSRLQSPASTARVQSRLIQVLNCWRWAQCCCGVASCYFWCLWNIIHIVFVRVSVCVITHVFGRPSAHLPIHTNMEICQWMTPNHCAKTI